MQSAKSVSDVLVSAAVMALLVCALPGTLVELRAAVVSHSLGESEAEMALSSEEALTRRRRDIDFQPNANSENAEDEPCVGCAKERQLRRLKRELQLDEETLRQMRIDLFKKQILQRLGLAAPPNITAGMPRPAVPEPLRREMELAAQKQEEEAEEDDSKPSEVVTFGTPITTCRSTHPSGCFHFRFKNNLQLDLIDSAELWVYRLQDPASTRNHTLVLSELRRHHRLMNRNERRLDIPPAQPQRGWVKFDVRSTVRHWMRHPDTNYGLRVSCPTCQMDPEAVPIANHDEHRVYIALKMRRGRLHRRSRRATARNCTPSANTECCREKLEVNFADIGWGDWVIVPQTYEAYYCQGTCHYIDQVENSHSVVLRQVKHLQTDPKRREDMEFCCSPKKLRGMSMLYLDDNDVIQKEDLTNISVEECGCL